MAIRSVTNTSAFKVTAVLNEDDEKTAWQVRVAAIEFAETNWVLLTEQEHEIRLRPKNNACSRPIKFKSLSMFMNPQPQTVAIMYYNF